MRVWPKMAKKRSDHFKCNDIFLSAFLFSGANTNMFSICPFQKKQFSNFCGEIQMNACLLLTLPYNLIAKWPNTEIGNRGFSISPKSYNINIVYLLHSVAHSLFCCLKFYSFIRCRLFGFIPVSWPSNPSIRIWFNIFRRSSLRFLFCFSLVAFFDQIKFRLQKYAEAYSGRKLRKRRTELIKCIMLLLNSPNSWLRFTWK